MSNYSVITSSRNIDIIDVSDDVLQHAANNTQHTGYYSPNLSGTADKKKDDYHAEGIKVFQESPNAGGGVFVQLYLIPNDRHTITRYQMQFSIGDSTGVNRSRISSEFMNAYDRQRSSSRGLPYLSENQKNKISSLILNAYDSWNSGRGRVYGQKGITKKNTMAHSLFTEVYDMDEYLEHHGILGMKWGVRRYQNEDGSLTNLGKKRYNVKGTRAQLENAKTDAERRLILTKSRNKAIVDLVASYIGGHVGTVATGALLVALPMPLTALSGIPLALGAANFFRSVNYNIYKGIKLSELKAEFDVSTNVTRSRNDEENKARH